LLSEESTASVAANPAAASAPAQPAQRYHEAAHPDQQARLTDFLPTRRRTLLALFLLGLGFLAALETGYWFFHAAAAGSLHLSLVDLAGPDNLANWFGSVILLKAAVTSLVIYSLRRHRLDDYRARYRLWLWTALACFVMSIGEVTNLQDDFQAVMGQLTAWQGPGAEYAWWLGVWSTVMAIITVRMAFELRRCVPATLALYSAIALWCLPIAVRLGWSPELAFPLVMLAVGAKLLGHLCFWLAIGVYSRHIVLDIEGKLPPAKVRTKRVKVAKRPAAKVKESEAAEGESKKEPARDKKMMLDPPHTTPAAPNAKRSDLGPLQATVAARSAAAAPAGTLSARPASGPKLAAATVKPSPVDEDEEDDDEAGSASGNRRMSRSERRKLRRDQRDGVGPAGNGH
jgi:hypothetical protein